MSLTVVLDKKSRLAVPRSAGWRMAFRWLSQLVVVLFDMKQLFFSLFILDLSVAAVNSVSSGKLLTKVLKHSLGSGPFISQLIGILIIVLVLYEFKLVVFQNQDLRLCKSGREFFKRKKELLAAEHEQ